MRNLFQLTVGLMLVIIGGVKAWTHATSASYLFLPMCTGRTLSVPIEGGMTLASLHCWGCYVAVIGVVMVAYDIYTRRIKYARRVRLAD